METPTVIHIPDSDGVYYSVSVYPHKLYNGDKGSELIEKYSKRKRQRPSTVIVKDSKIHLPCGILPDKITIKGNEYKTEKILNRIEEIAQIRIYSRRNNRILKHFQNVTIQLPKLF